MKPDWDFEPGIWEIRPLLCSLDSELHKPTCVLPEASIQPSPTYLVPPRLFRPHIFQCPYTQCLLLSRCRFGRGRQRRRNSIFHHLKPDRRVNKGCLRQYTLPSFYLRSFDIEIRSFFENLPPTITTSIARQITLKSRLSHHTLCGSVFAASFRKSSQHHEDDDKALPQNCHHGSVT